LAEFKMRADYANNILHSHKNFKMKRNPRKLKWTKSFRKAHGKEMTVDSTLAFSARRNVPVRYNRELVQKTLVAMKRVEEIRLRRERAFYRQRMKGNKARTLEEDRKLVEEHQHLLPPNERYVRNELDAMEGVEEQLDMDQLTTQAGEMEVEEMESDDGDSGEESEEEIAQRVTVKSRLPATKKRNKMILQND
jgi:large subunit ribosomal protein L24e